MCFGGRFEELIYSAKSQQKRLSQGKAFYKAGNSIRKGG
jgi:hypothetical protein